MIRFNSIRSPSYNNGSNNGSIAYATLQLCALLYHHNNSVPVSQQTIIRRLRRLLSTITIIRSQFLSSQQSTVRRLQSTITIIRSMFSSQQSTVRSLTTINRKPSTVYPYNKSVAVSQPSTGRCHVLKIDSSRRPSSLIVFVFVLQ